jgi:shikimate kinase
MAAGKSRVGGLLAQRLNLPFVDTDSKIEEIYGVSVAQIFLERGEPEFRKAERKLILRLLQSGEPQVIAIGGGAFVDPHVRDALNRQARTVWLDAPFELVLKRLSRSTVRPLAADKAEPELRALWNERRSHYVEAQLRIETSDADPRRIVEQIIEELR